MKLHRARQASFKSPEALRSKILDRICSRHMPRAFLPLGGLDREKNELPT